MILNKEDNDNIHKKRDESIGKNPIWLGAEFSKHTLTWQNELKSNVFHGFQSWFLGEPNNFGGSHGKSENCLTMHFGGQWTTENCEIKISVICERPGTEFFAFLIEIQVKFTIFYKTMIELLELLSAAAAFQISYF